MCVRRFWRRVYGMGSFEDAIRLGTCCIIFLKFLSLCFFVTRGHPTIVALCCAKRWFLRRAPSAPKVSDGFLLRHADVLRGAAFPFFAACSKCSGFEETPGQGRPRRCPPVMVRCDTLFAGDWSRPFGDFQVALMARPSYFALVERCDLAFLYHTVGVCACHSQG